MAIKLYCHSRLIFGRRGERELCLDETCQSGQQAGVLVGCELSRVSCRVFGSLIEHAVLIQHRNSVFMFARCSEPCRRLLDPSLPQYD